MEGNIVGHSMKTNKRFLNLQNYKKLKARTRWKCSDYRRRYSRTHHW